MYSAGPIRSPSGYMTADPIRGHRHVPGAVGHLRTDEFDATYSIDARGARDIPAHRDAPAGRPVVEIFGDSFTFGHGVADDVPYPAVLQRDHWPYMDVRNRGVNGYGTMQAVAAAVQGSFGKVYRAVCRGQARGGGGGGGGGG